MKKYKYSIMTVADVSDEADIFVPNCYPDEAVQIWRYFSGFRDTFPAYKDYDTFVTDVSDEAWCTKDVYRKAYCPLDMMCIVREEIESR